MADSLPFDDPSSFAAQQRHDAICDEFEAAWQAVAANPRLPLPRLEQLLARVHYSPPDLQSALFHHLLLLEWQWLRALGEPIDVEAYLARFPQYQDLIRPLYEAAFVLTRPQAGNATAPSPGPETSSLPAIRLGNDAKEPPIPRQIGDYQIQRRLGYGAYGDVYLANDQHLQRQVAIKVPRADRFPRGIDPHWFLAEARKVCKLEHPNIVGIYHVGIYHVGENDEIPFIVMEYVEGETLEERLKSERPDEPAFQPGEAAELMAQIAEAVDHAHRKGFIHRDLKPGNILLDSAGQPHITDFGLALCNDDRRLQPCEAVVGTLLYMAPEQVRGEARNTCPQTDVWALGVILYEMLAGERPFGGQTLEQLKDEITSYEPRSLTLLRDDALIRRLDRICDRCLKKTPGERYRTAGELASDLRKALRPSRRRQVVLLAAAPLCVLLTAAVATWAAIEFGSNNPPAVGTGNGPPVDPGGAIYGRVRTAVRDHLQKNEFIHAWEAIAQGEDGLPPARVEELRRSVPDAVGRRALELCDQQKFVEALKLVEAVQALPGAAGYMIEIRQDVAARWLNKLLTQLAAGDPSGVAEACETMLRDRSAPPALRQRLHLTRAHALARQYPADGSPFLSDLKELERLGPIPKEQAPVFYALLGLAKVRGSDASHSDKLAWLKEAVAGGALREPSADPWLREEFSKTERETLDAALRCDNVAPALDYLRQAGTRSPADQAQRLKEAADEQRAGLRLDQALLLAQARHKALEQIYSKQAGHGVLAASLCEIGQLQIALQEEDAACETFEQAVEMYFTLSSGDVSSLSQEEQQAFAECYGTLVSLPRFTIERSKQLASRLFDAASRIRREVEALELLQQMADLARRLARPELPQLWDHAAAVHGRVIELIEQDRRLFEAKFEALKCQSLLERAAVRIETCNAHPSLPRQERSKLLQQATADADAAASILADSRLFPRMVRGLPGGRKRDETDELRRQLDEVRANLQQAQRALEKNPLVAAPEA